MMTFIKEYSEDGKGKSTPKQTSTNLATLNENLLWAGQTHNYLAPFPSLWRTLTVICNLYNKLLQSPRRNDFTLTMIKQALTTSLNKSSNGSQTPPSIAAKPNRFMSRSPSSLGGQLKWLSIWCVCWTVWPRAQSTRTHLATLSPGPQLFCPFLRFSSKATKDFFFFSPWDPNSLPGEGSRRQRGLTARYLPPVSTPTKSLPWGSRPRLHGNQDRGESPCFSVK